MSNKVPLVVIVGGGFGGLAAAKALRRAPINVLLIDRLNHHVFQPLLYQVATSVLAPGQIASPLRGLLADQDNNSVMLGNVTGIDPATRHVIVDAGDQKELRVAYDYLVLATGATHSYFGHDNFARFAPGLKSLADAESLPNHILTSFENTDVEENPERPAGTNGIRYGGRLTDWRRDGKRNRRHGPDDVAEELPSYRPKIRTHHPG
jgi:NADH:ubiquinone reductase (H+-translocating)